jgi:hypothetical protein
MDVSLVHNERTKLTAAWLNTQATALVAAGTFAPAVTVVYGLSKPGIDAIYIGILMCACFAAGLGLHMTARATLGSLRE